MDKLIIPKILAIAYISFISIFASDSENFVGLLIHLIPTFIFTALLIIAWFKPKIGGILFTLAGIGTIFLFNTYKNIFSFLIISVIPIIAGILFLKFKGKK